MGIRENQKKGIQAEKDYFAIESALNPTKRTGRGSDFETTITDPITGKKVKERVDIKTGKHAKRSKLQKKMGTKVVKMLDLTSDESPI